MPYSSSEEALVFPNPTLLLIEADGKCCALGPLLLFYVACAPWRMLLSVTFFVCLLTTFSEHDVCWRCSCFPVVAVSGSRARGGYKKGEEVAAPIEL